MRSMTPVITQLSTALFHLRSNILYSTYIFYNITVRMLIYTGIPTATYQLMGTFYIKFTQIIRYLARFDSHTMSPSGLQFTK